MFPKDLYRAEYQYLINVRESVGLNRFNDSEAFIEYSNDIRDVYKNIDKFNDPKAFIEYSNVMQDIYEDIDEHNIDKKRKILIVLDDMIADMINNFSNN